jgi:hypothetical protein
VFRKHHRVDEATQGLGRSGCAFWLLQGRFQGLDPAGGTARAKCGAVRSAVQGVLHGRDRLAAFQRAQLPNQAPAAARILDRIHNRPDLAGEPGLFGLQLAGAKPRSRTSSGVAGR